MMMGGVMGSCIAMARGTIEMMVNRGLLTAGM